MDPSSHWKELNDRQYKFHLFNSITGDMKNLDFFHSKVAISKWGGPLAGITFIILIFTATKNNEHIVLMRTDDILKDSICFFSNSGKIFTRVPYKDNERVYSFLFS